jgi:hypothetical protein
MKLDLIRPCPNCPFRTEPRFHLSKGRAQGIADLLLNGHHFWCHETIDYTRQADGLHPAHDASQLCAGSMILLQKIGEPNDAMEVGQWIGTFDAERLDMDSPVYDTMEEFVARTEEGMS